MRIRRNGSFWTARSRVRVALVVGLSLIAFAAVAVLSSSPLVVAGGNSVEPRASVIVTRSNAVYCQGGETLPAGTAAIRVWVITNVSPRVQVIVYSGLRIVTRGELPPGRLASTLAIPVSRVSRALADVEVCFKVGPVVERMLLIGGRTPDWRPGETPVKVRVEYLRAGPRSWWSLAPSVARHIGLGRAPSGTWAWLTPIVLMALASVLAVWLVARQLGGERSALGPVGARPARGRVRGLLRGAPAPAWICACVACLSAASWSILTPPFQVPDEPSHFAYVQQLAQAGSLPSSADSAVSEEEEVALRDLHHGEVRFNAAVHTILTAEQQSLLESDLARPLVRRGVGDAGVAAQEPPLYYMLETIPYFLGSSGSLLDRLALMRLLSALMAGIAALFAFLFLREAIPRAPWAWTVGALATALAPLVGFTTGAVTPDAMLCAVCAALFWCLARAFRRGLTRRLAIATGVVVAIGLLTKLNFLGLVPGVVVALVVLARRASRTGGRAAYRSLAAASAVLAIPVCVYIAINLLSNHPALGPLSGAVAVTSRVGSLTREVAFIWQYYLPRLPGMTNDFRGISPTRQIWFDRSVGMYGWLDTYFAPWVYDLALIPTVLIAVLCARTLIASRAALRARAGELLSYALIGVGVMALVGANAYVSSASAGGSYAEPRYLLPMAVLFAAVLALAARGAGRRWGPPVGALIVLLILAHDIFSQLLVVGRYYG
jgi:predicted membrane protein DUF2142